MTWPTSAVVTTNLDQGTDEPRLARVELKQAVDNVNAIVAEFGTVNTAASTNDQVLVKSGGVWTGSNTITNLDLLDFDTTSALTPTAGQLTWDGAQGTLSFGVTNNIVTRIGQDLFANVTNAESVTITKGQPVYHFGATGDRASVKLALNTSDATSAKTFGIAAENITAGSTGMIMTQGILDGLDLGAYTAGDTLYLGATAGSLTATKPKAPNHMVYLGTVSRANAGNGIMFVKIQNGYELDEIHDVAITAPVVGQVLQYAAGNVWINANVAAGGGGTGTSTQYLTMNTLNYTVPNTYEQINTTFTEMYAGSAGVTTTGNVMVFGSGTYLIDMDSIVYFNTGNSTAVYRVQLYNDTDAASIVVYDTETQGLVSSIYRNIVKLGTVKLVLTGTKNIILRHYDSAGTSPSAEWENGLIKITKIA